MGAGLSAAVGGVGAGPSVAWVLALCVWVVMVVSSPSSMTPPSRDEGCRRWNFSAFYSGLLPKASRSAARILAGLIPATERIARVMCAWSL